MLLKEYIEEDNFLKEMFFWGTKAKLINIQNNIVTEVKIIAFLFFFKKVFFSLISL